MIIPDANILLYATDQDCVDHRAALAWWKKTLCGPQEIGLCAVVAFAFIRLSTNRKVFRNPLEVKDACARVANWLEFRNVVWLDSTLADFETAARFLNVAGVGGNLATDAQIAAIALRVGASIRSCDHDFARFPEIKWSDPLR
jgi:toxin-antitoxin system PIN domain toxin